MFVLLRMDNIIMEKKEYISPVAEIVEVGTLSMLAFSKESDEQIDDSEQWTGESRGDWNNIWENM